MCYQTNQVDLPKDHFHAPGQKSRICSKKSLAVLSVAVITILLWITSQYHSFWNNNSLQSHFIDHQDYAWQEQLRQLNQSIKGNVWFPTDSQFVEASRVWRQDLAVTPPRAVIECHSEADVQQAVQALSQLRIPFRIRSGGHNKAGYSTVADGIVLSLKHMRRIEIAKNTEISDGESEESILATFQPGATVENLLDELLVSQSTHKEGDDDSNGYAGAIGQCGKVAEGGWVLGGGVGFMSRKLGLGIDNVVGFRVVLANGTVVLANQHDHSDLFWALRGAGSGNYGVVTSITYRLHPGVPDRQLFQMIEVPFVNLGDLLFQLEFATKHSREFMAIAGGREGDYAKLYLSWFSTEEKVVTEGQKHFDREILPLLPNSTMSTTPNFQYQEFFWAEDTHRLFDQGYGSTVFSAQTWQGFLMPINNTLTVWRKIMDTITQGMQAAPDLEPHIELWGGAISETTVEATAFPYREAIYNLGVLLVIPSSNDKDDDEDEARLQLRFQQQVASVNQWWPQVAQYLNGAYLNYPMNSLAADEYPGLYWGHHLDRLMEIKQQYDPHNLFAYEQSMPTKL